MDPEMDLKDPRDLDQLDQLDQQTRDRDPEETRMNLQRHDKEAVKQPDTPPAVPDSPPDTSVVPGNDNSPTSRPDPTRYGDWEKNGRCIDF